MNMARAPVTAQHSCQQICAWGKSCALKSALSAACWANNRHIYHHWSWPASLSNRSQTYTTGPASEVVDSCIVRRTVLAALRLSSSPLYVQVSPRTKLELAGRFGSQGPADRPCSEGLLCALDACDKPGRTAMNSIVRCHSSGSKHRPAGFLMSTNLTTQQLWSCQK